MLWLFWISVAFLVYTFIGFPTVLWLLSRVRDHEHKRGTIQPTVSVLITAYNEGTRLRGKLTNTVALDYPREKLEIIVASDGSDDDTEAIAQSFARQGVKLLRVKPRQGKNHAQMLARDASKGEVLVFTDASVQLDKRALLQIVCNFADSSVGCVSSEDCIMHGPSAKVGEGTYVDFEMWLRRLESRLGSVITASGSFFAARREVCARWHPDQTSDFFVPLHTIEQRQRAVVDSLTLGYYGLAVQSGAEFQRKVRTIVNGLHVFFAHRRLLNPLQYPMTAWQLLSHKLCRWLVPFGILGLLVTNFFLAGLAPFYRVALVAQAAVYIVGLLAVIWTQLLQFKGFKLASFFMLGSAATVTAWFKFCLGERFVIWQPTQRS